MNCGLGNSSLDHFKGSNKYIISWIENGQIIIKDFEYVGEMTDAAENYLKSPQSQDGSEAINYCTRPYKYTTQTTESDRHVCTILGRYNGLLIEFGGFNWS